MRDIPVWLLVLVGMVGVLAFSLLVYVLLAQKLGAAQAAEPDVPPAPADQPGPVVGEDALGRHALRGESESPDAPVQRQVANGAVPPDAAVPMPVESRAAAIPAGAASPQPDHRPEPEPAPSSEPIGTPRNGTGPAAPHETAARNGASAEWWEPPAVPAELAPPSRETLAIWAAQTRATEPPAPPSADVAAQPYTPPPESTDPPAYAAMPAAPPPESPESAHTHAAALPAAASPLVPDVEAPTPPSGLATDPAMSGIGWSEIPPLALADPVAQPPASELNATPPQPDSALPNSAPPGPNGSSPSQEYTIKGNEGSRRFHTPDSPFYIRTRADVWFRTIEDAEGAGFAPWNQRRR